MPIGSAISKIVIPSVYKEWQHHGPPDWVANETFFANEYNYSVFLYQKLNASLPNFISTNRGRENGAYYRYIVDHYYNLPDVMIFVHAHPLAHQPTFLDMIGCISENASYISLNLNSPITRSTTYFKKHEVWVEQCWRDTLKVIWNMTSAELAARVPLHHPITISMYCCQQFLVSREMIHRRSFETWQRLLELLGEQNVCHEGEPEYDSLHVYARNPAAERVGPEPSDLDDLDNVMRGTGRVTQAVASEHLSHVIFGHLPLDMSWVNMDTLCQNFVSRSVCPGSPCLRGGMDPTLVDGALVRPSNKHIKVVDPIELDSIPHGGLLIRKQPNSSGNETTCGSRVIKAVNIQ